ncbi:MAG: phosphatase PAP2 family protein [Desulfovibrio sp.]|jgi:undecaprenyl-diphosphatase|nr:phosphatase PAP2 family protein [Desulfovibrio sp.]
MRYSFTRSIRGYPWRHQLLCLLPSVALLCCLALFVGDGDASTLYFKEASVRHPFVTKGMRFLTNWTNIALYAFYATLFLCGLRRKNRSPVRFVLIFISVQIFVSAILVQLCKITVGKPRPLPALEGFGYSPFNAKGMFHSFPSGHTSEAAGAAFPLANRYKKPLISLFLGLLVALLGFSRIYLTMHDIADVAGGLAAGVLAGILNHHLCCREQP